MVLVFLLAELPYMLGLIPTLTIEPVISSSGESQQLYVIRRQPN